MINADKIRAMSDEELAFMIICPAEYDLSFNKNKDCDGGMSKNCFECTLKWLQSESKVQVTSKKSKIDIHKEICSKLNETYKAKNNDYGDSFAKLRTKYPNAILIRLSDKLNRLDTLIMGGKQEVDESIEDFTKNDWSIAMLKMFDEIIDNLVEV